MPSNDFNGYDFEALAASTLTGLEELDLSSLERHERYNDHAGLQTAALQALVTWPGLATVRSLNLNGNFFSLDGLRALLGPPHVGGLKELYVRDTTLDGEAMAAFDSARPALRLDVLDLGQNLLRDVGAEYVALVKCLAELKVLRLDRCEITRTGGHLFGKKASFLRELRMLDVGYNSFGADGVMALLNRQPPALHTLGLRDNDLFDEGAERLAGVAAAEPLAELELSDNGIGPAGAKALGESPHLPNLLVLRFSGNLTSEAMEAALTASPLGHRLKVLEFREEPPPPRAVDEVLQPNPPPMPYLSYDGGNVLPPPAANITPPDPPSLPPASEDDIPF